MKGIDDIDRILLRCLVAMVLFLGIIIFLCSEADAHEGPSGWTYPLACCSNQDCREVPDAAVDERPEGYVIVATGEVVPTTSAKVRHSPDGRFHWCSAGGRPDGRTICLFVPPRLF